MYSIDFSKRSDVEEIMDDLDCSGEVVNQTLREIGFINKTLGGNALTLDGIDALLKGRRGTYSLADMGCGGGEMLSIMYDWGQKKGYDFDLTGIDANPNIIHYAESVVDHSDIKFQVENVENSSFIRQKYDILTATLFLHHISSEKLSELIKKWMRQAKIGLVINDLHRHPLAYHSIRFMTQVLSKSEMVKYDAPLSVLRGFTRKEWEEILANAGITHYKLRWRWAFRWQLVIYS